MTFKLTGRRGMEETINCAMGFAIVEVVEETGHLSIDINDHSGISARLFLEPSEALLLAASLSRAAWRHTKQDANAQAKATNVD